MQKIALLALSFLLTACGKPGDGSRCGAGTVPASPDSKPAGAPIDAAAIESREYVLVVGNEPTRMEREMLGRYSRTRGSSLSGAELIRPRQVEKPAHYDPAKRPKRLSEVEPEEGFSQPGPSARKSASNNYEAAADELIEVRSEMYSIHRRMEQVRAECVPLLRSSDPKDVEAVAELAYEIKAGEDKLVELRARSCALDNDAVQAVLLQRMRASGVEPMPVGDSSFGPWSTGGEPIRP